jgi:peptidoglycan/LPS O-acetylase OafA/YrhL
MEIIAVVIYSVAGGIWLFWILDQQVFFGEPTRAYVALGVLGFIHLLVGLTIRRWWALFLPFILVFFAIPLAYPDPNRGEPFPVWFGVLFWTPAFLFLIATGVGARKVWQRGRSSAAT